MYKVLVIECDGVAAARKYMGHGFGQGWKLRLAFVGWTMEDI